MRLASLRPEGRRLLTQDFLSGSTARLSEQDYRDSISEMTQPIDLAVFCAEVARYANTLEPQQSDQDGEIAVRIHQSLPLLRREAAEVGVWRFLAVVVAPELIRKRWSAKEKTFRNRFWMWGVRPDSNYYSRLWWIAELTAGEEKDYGRTRQVFRSQSLANAIFVRNLGHYFPAVKACVDVLGKAQTEVVFRVMKGLHRELALITKEALTDADVADLLRAELERVPMR